MSQREAKYVLTSYGRGNQVRLSCWLAVVFAGLTWLFTVVLAGWVNVTGEPLVFSPNEGTFRSLINRPPSGLIFWLARSGVFPWRAVPSLEDATARILLRRVGRGYSFVHRLLLDYFADLDAQTHIPQFGRALFGYALLQL